MKELSYITYILDEAYDHLNTSVLGYVRLYKKHHNIYIPTSYATAVFAEFLFSVFFIYIYLLIAKVCFKFKGGKSLESITNSTR
jgi:hypothetical protein